MENEKIINILNLAKKLESKRLKDEYEVLSKTGDFGSFENYKLFEPKKKDYQKESNLNNCYIFKDTINKDKISVGMYLINYEHIEPPVLDEDYRPLPQEKNKCYEYSTVISFPFINPELNISGIFRGVEKDKNVAINKYEEIKNFLISSSESRILEEVEKCILKLLNS